MPTVPTAANNGPILGAMDAGKIHGGACSLFPGGDKGRNRTPAPSRIAPRPKIAEILRRRVVDVRWLLAA